MAEKWTGKHLKEIEHMLHTLCCNLLLSANWYIFIMWAAWTWTIRSQAFENGELQETQCKYFCRGFGAFVEEASPHVVLDSTAVPLLILDCWWWCAPFSTSCSPDWRVFTLSEKKQWSFTSIFTSQIICTLCYLLLQ